MVHDEEMEKNQDVELVSPGISIRMVKKNVILAFLCHSSCLFFLISCSKPAI